MSNIVKFPSHRQSQTASDLPVEGQALPGARPANGLLRAFHVLLAIVRVPAFLVLYWLRPSS